MKNRPRSKIWGGFSLLHCHQRDYAVAMSAPQQGPGPEEPGQPDHQQQPYQQNPYPQGPAQPGYQQPVPGAYQQPMPGQGGFGAPQKSPASDFSSFPARLQNLSGIPQEVRWAFLLVVAAAALSILYGLINIFVSTGRYGGLAVVGAVIGFVFNIVVGAIYVWFGLLAKERVGWARIVVICLGGLMLISGLITLVSAIFTGIGFIQVLSSLAGVAAAVLLLLPASNAYYARTGSAY